MVQKPQGAVVTSRLRQSRSGLGPETQDPRALHTPKGPDRAKGPVPTKQPPGVSKYILEHPTHREPPTHQQVGASATGREGGERR